MIPNLTGKTKAELLQLAELTEALANRRKYNWLHFIFPDKGKYARSEYSKAMEFFAAGADHRFRMLGGANGSGKSFNLTSELVYHVTGNYPDWWVGKRQKTPKLWWIVVESADLFKSSMQRLLLGDSLNEEDVGTGLIPKDQIIGYGAWGGVTGAVRSIEVRHKDGHIVTIEVKTFEQESYKLASATIDGVLFDEEPPFKIHEECIFRLRGSPKKPPGISMLGFTPLKGLTEVVLSYLENGEYPKDGQHKTDPSIYVVRIDMDEVPHLTDEDKEMYRKKSSPQDRDARIHGYPSMGSGKIYPYPESQVFVKPLEIPEYWPRAFSLDFGSKSTCVLWGAKDPHTKILYIYAEYYPGVHHTAQIHALNIQARGKWIKGICDPSGGGKQDDGRQMIEIYQSLGIDLTPGENAIQAGIMRNCNMFENGTLKIFDNLEHTKKEYRLYRYDTKYVNEPALNQSDHAMDNIKYMTSMFDYVAQTEYDSDDYGYRNEPRSRHYDPTTGY